MTRALLQQALDALEDSDAANPCDYGRQEKAHDLATATITAIREYLAQPEEEVFGYWFNRERRFASLDEGDRYFDADEREELLIPLYTKEQL